MSDAEHQILLDKIAQTIKYDTKEQTVFSSLDLRYAYSHITSDKKTREQCNFSLIGGNENKPVPNWILRSNRYAGRFPKSN